MERLKSVLSVIFGKDTRGIQILNLYIHVIWLIMMGLYLNDPTKVSFIGSILTHITMLTILCAILITVILVSIKAIGERKQVLKIFGLLLGSVIQGIISSGYVKAYPPLDTMSIFCISLCFWFAGAALYVVKVEGFNVRLKKYDQGSSTTLSSKL